MRALLLFALLLVAGCSDDAPTGDPAGLTTGAAGQAGAAAQAGASGSAGETAGGSAGAAAGQGGTSGSSGSAGATLPAGPWACIGKVTTPPADSPRINVRLPLVDLVTGEPRPGVTVRVCGALDPICDAVPTNPTYITDAGGFANLEIGAQPKPFDGYFKIAEAPGVSAGLVFMHPKATTNETTLTPVRTISQLDLRAIVEAGGTVWNSARGHIFIAALDCENKPGTGVTWSLANPQDATRFFLSGGAPSTKAAATTTDGYGGWFLVSAGLHTLTMSHDGQEMPERRVRVEPGTITYTVASPSL